MCDDDVEESLGMDSADGKEANGYLGIGSSFEDIADPPCGDENDDEEEELVER
jgi:hypothetical protein